MATFEIGKPLAESIENLPLKDASDQSILFGNLLKRYQSVTVVAFLRHFGCIGCSEHVDHWMDRLNEFQRLDIQLIFVGNGESRYIDSFAERFGLKDRNIPVVSDPTLSIHKAVELNRSLAKTFGPSSIKNALRAFGKSHFQTSLEGDALQQGGLVIFDSKHVPQFVHRETAVGDFLDLTEVFERCMRLLQNKEIL